MTRSPIGTAVPVELTDAALAAEVVDGLALVEKQLADATQSEEELLAEASTHLLEAGGKRLRARCSPCCARSCATGSTTTSSRRRPASS